jgi:site-specific DNA recombinase
MLDNSLYAGIISRLSDNFEGRHEAIISPDIWDKAQEIRKGRSYRSARYTALLSGIIYCGECGTRMRSKKLHGVSYPYYVCYAQDRSHPDMIKSDNHCLCGYKPAHKIDQKVIGQLGNGQAKIALPEVKKKDTAKTRAQLEKKLADTNKRLNRWYMAFEKEAIDIMELNERVLELKNEKKYLEKQIEMIELEKEEVRQRQINMSVLSELLKSFPLLWEKGTREERRALIVKIVSRVTVYKDNKVEVEYHVK